MAADTLEMKRTNGVPTMMVHVMETGEIEHFSGHPPGTYLENPEKVYLDMQRSIGACLIDQYIPRNPLSMHSDGYGKETERGATTGAEEIVVDGMAIDSPEAVVEHLEKYVFPGLESATAGRDPEATGAERELIEAERKVQEEFGPEILKSPYGRGYNGFPYLRYGTYGYVNYFMAYALYPEVMEKDFRLQADRAVQANRTAVRAIEKGGLPKVIRLDHDMADSRSTLVDIKTLDKLWFPHFERSIRPYVEAGIRLLWHCDGNLMQMVPRLIAAGVGGFQGFQYEDGMDYEAICRMKDRDGGPLMIWAGVSVTRTLPHGSPEDVKKELRKLVEQGPETGLFLGASSSVAPGVPRKNLETFFEGLKYYRERGRGDKSS